MLPTSYYLLLTSYYLLLRKKISVNTFHASIEKTTALTPNPHPYTLHEIYTSLCTDKILFYIYVVFSLPAVDFFGFLTALRWMGSWE